MNKVLEKKTFIPVTPSASIAEYLGDLDRERE